MKTLYLLLFSMLFGLTANAQMPTGNLTIFSEDGAPFYLILNGERYNKDAQTNVRVEMLTNPYYKCKVVFANKKIAPLEKNVMIADADGIMLDVNYRVKKDKKGKRSLKFYSGVPAVQNMAPPAHCAVYHYGEPNDMYVGPDGTMYHQTVTTSTTNSQGYGMNVNMPGFGMNVNIPADEVVTTTTTTTTTTGGYQNNGNNGNYNNGNNGGYNNNGNYNNGNNNGGYNNNQGNYNNQNNNNQQNNTGGCRNAMNSTDFSDAIETIQGSNFDDTRLSSAKEIIATNCMSTNQILSLVKLLTFEENKLDLAKYAYGYCVERNNYFKVVNAFTFESSKEELNDYIKSQR
jgi:Domain of unknown function (DUF4476)